MIIKLLSPIITKLLKKSIKPIIVGGFVRDMLLHVESKDIDIELFNVSSLNDVKETLQEFGSLNEVGKSFGVLKLSYHGVDIDFSLPRTEKKIAQGYCGFDVTCSGFLSYKEAAIRRDFTINSIGYDVEKSQFLDPFNGVEDLQNSRLHYVNEKTFVEDPLRFFRAVQFSARFNLKVSSELFELLKNMVTQNSLCELSNERIFIEFEKLFLKSKKPSIGLELLKALHVEQSFNFFKRVFEHPLHVIDRVEKRELKIYFCTMLFYCSNIEEAMQSFTCNKELIHSVVTIQKHTLHVMHKSLCDVDIQKLALHVELDDVINMLNIFDFRSNFEQRVDALHVRYSPIKEIVMGRDLISFGLQPSAKFKNILKLCYDVQLKNPKMSKDEILRCVVD